MVNGQWSMVNWARKRKNVTADRRFLARRLTMALLLLFLILPASAQSDEVERLRKQIAQYEAEIAACNDLIAKSKKSQSVSESQLKVVRTQLSKRREMVAALGKQLDAIEGDITARRSDIMRLEDDLTVLKDDYAKMVYDSWKGRRHNDFMLFLFSASDFNAATRRAEFMRRYNRARAEKARQIGNLSMKIEGEVSELDATRAELDATRKTRNEEATSLARDERTHSASVKKLTADQKNLQKQIAEKQALRRKAQGQIDALIAAEVRRAGGQTLSEADQRAFDALSGRFEDNRGRLPYPVAGGVVTDHFGEHAHQLASSARVNNPGVNITGADGAAVKCVFEGEVTEIVSIPGFNRCILVRHGSFITVYANLLSTSVRKGQRVAAGETLGHLGAGEEGFLHFEIHAEAGGQTAPQNPELWLRR